MTNEMLFDDVQVDVMSTKAKILLVDFHNLMYRTVYGTIASTPEDNEKFMLTKHNLLTTIMYTVENFQPNQIVFAIDSKNSWRYDVYKEYKANRKDRPSPLNTELFYPIMEEFITDLAQLFSNMRFMKISRCEADDIIAVLCENLPNASITILSGDSDMNQLLERKNVKQYDPLKGDYVNCINPKASLEVKIISGDSSDNIKGIRQRVGPKTAEKIVVEGLMTYLDDEKNKVTPVEKKEILDRYIRNKTLIDFKYIPANVRKSIIEEYRSYELKPIPREFVSKFFAKHKLVKLMSDWATKSAMIRAVGGV